VSVIYFGNIFWEVTLFRRVEVHLTPFSLVEIQDVTSQKKGLSLYYKKFIGIEMISM
jgi:hypothetical protein